ncbi:MAG: energy transducer TonB [Bacteroidia bacterium]
MKKGILIICFVFLNLCLCAQNNAPLEKRVFADVDEMPRFPGGEDSLKAFLHRNIEYFFEFRLINFQGNNFVSFTVAKNGKIKDVQVLQTCGYEKIDSEVVRVFNSMPAWIPGKDKDEDVDVHLYLNVDIYPE